MRYLMFVCNPFSWFLQFRGAGKGRPRGCVKLDKDATMFCLTRINFSGENSIRDLERFGNHPWHFFSHWNALWEKVYCAVPCWEEGGDGCQSGPLGHAMTWSISSSVLSTEIFLSPLWAPHQFYPAAPSEPLIPAAWEQLQLAVS